MQKEYKFSGSTGGTSIVTINDDIITIKRKGVISAFAHGMNSEKTIRIENISGVQYKKSGLTVGYLQFIVIGSQETKGKLMDHVYDENAVSFAGNKGNEYAEEIKNYIENYQSRRNSNNTNTSKSPIEQVKELKELLDIGAITQEEFDKKKTELLGL